MLLCQNDIRHNSVMHDIPENKQTKTKKKKPVSKENQCPFQVWKDSKIPNEEV